VGAGVTHVVAAIDANEIELEEAKEVFEIPVVSPRWVAYCVHLGKILP